jgi:hypothetical protein
MKHLEPNVSCINKYQKTILVDVRMDNIFLEFLICKSWMIERFWP